MGWVGQPFSVLKCSVSNTKWQRWPRSSHCGALSSLPGRSQPFLSMLLSLLRSRADAFCFKGYLRSSAVGSGGSRSLLLFLMEKKRRKIKPTKNPNKPTLLPSEVLCDIFSPLLPALWDLNSFHPQLGSKVSSGELCRLRLSSAPRYGGAGRWVPLHPEQPLPAGCQMNPSWVSRAAPCSCVLLRGVLCFANDELLLLETACGLWCGVEPLKLRVCFASHHWCIPA